MKKLLFVLAGAAALAACASEGAVYKPQAQIMPQHIKKIAVRQILNRTEVFALEDKFYNELYDEFLRNGTYQIVSENADAQGVVATTISRYLNVPIQYDSQLIPTVYRMDIWLDVVLIDKSTNAPVWREPALLGTQIYAASTLPGGMTEVQARDVVFEKLSKDIVKRTVDGFGSVMSENKKKVMNNPEYTTITH
ncbi:MAG: LPS assembly lipoprotein LptE [Elusimicrobia bacterium]|nr:LPS assembly lipoprotein LptE [Elusimicrobiota bacterium]MDD7502409.1 LPS assembly lipoprotein LptE [Elusimicrobiota bacterium]MDY5728909.1 LPS assembly lipoprotein LptE [Elusimicrobiaceae bacterium]